MKIHLHLVSDSTGAAVYEVARGCMAQFPDLEFVRKDWTMIRYENDIQTIITTLRHEPGVVLVSLVDRKQQQLLKKACEEQDIPCISVIQDTIRAIETYSGQESSRKVGGKYKMDKEYFSRMEAMDFTLEHDDARSLSTIFHADMIILGVSRTSKTPTSIYLAHQGYKVANIPVLKDSFVPPGLELPRASPGVLPFVVGLVIDPDRLAHVRQYRSVQLQRGTVNKDYTDYATIIEEVRQATASYQRYGYPFVNVTFRSIEETAAEILKLFREHMDHKD
jgi:regulator of PEP synthase PpsR (kinase-PPPase family)